MTTQFPEPIGMLRPLSPREGEVLLRLSTFRALNTAQLEELVFAESRVRPASRRVLVRRILGRLRRRGLVAHSRRLVGGPEGGSARLAYHVTPAGYRIVAALEPALEDPVAPPRSHLFLEHALATAEVMLAFRRAARAHPGHQLAEWEPDWQAAERLRSAKVVPDARLVYATATWEVSAFVEVDLGSERPSRFAEKIDAYLDAYRAGAWRERLPAWPLVLTITTTLARVTALRRASEDVLERRRDRERLRLATEFDFAALPDLQRAPGPLGAIWQVAGRAGLHSLVASAAEGDASRPGAASVGSALVVPSSAVSLPLPEGNEDAAHLTNPDTAAGRIA